LFGWRHDMAGTSLCNDNLMLAFATSHPLKNCSLAPNHVVQYCSAVATLLRKLLQVMKS